MLYFLGSDCSRFAPQEGLLRKNGNERRANRLREVMEENGAQIPPAEYSVHDVTCVLKRQGICSLLPSLNAPKFLLKLASFCDELSLLRIGRVCRWLRCLPEPVVPRLLHDVFAKCVELESSHHHRTQALLLSCLLLPTFHLNTLKHVAVFLHVSCQRSFTPTDNKKKERERKREIRHPFSKSSGYT